MIRRRTLRPTRRRLPWPHRPRFRWPVLPSNILIAPTYPTLTLPADCGCCGATVPCCPGAVPTVVHLTVTTSGNGCCLGGPDGTYTLTYNAGTQTWIGQGVGGDGFVYQWLLSACTSGLDSFYLSSGYVAGSHSPGPGLGCDAWFHNQMAVASCSPFHLTGSFVLGNASTACPCYCPSSGGFTTLNCDVTA